MSTINRDLASLLDRMSVDPQCAAATSIDDQDRAKFIDDLSALPPKTLLDVHDFFSEKCKQARDAGASFDLMAYGIGLEGWRLVFDLLQQRRRDAEDAA